VGPRTTLDALEGEKSLSSACNGASAVQPIARSPEDSVLYIITGVRISYPAVMNFRVP
jgi:hypothetical protein